MDTQREVTAYTPPLGFSQLTPMYDAAIAAFTRERAWRSVVIKALAPIAGDAILDIGSGTGRMAEAVSKTQAGVNYLGLDPDADAVRTARKRMLHRTPSFAFEKSFFGGDERINGRLPDKIVTTLVLHQTPLAEKRRIVKAAFDLLPHGGIMIIADYGAQKSWLMRFLFRWTVQFLDGVADTQPNADGVIPILLKEAGFGDVAEIASVSTLTGTISVLKVSRDVPRGPNS